MSSTPETKKCLCGQKHEFQDKTYGKGQRVCTPVENINGNQGYKHRCTVCGKGIGDKLGSK